jgi:hypothetical protein
MRWVTRGGLIRLSIFFASAAVLLAIGYATMIRMPGTSHRGPLPPLSEEERALAKTLEEHVKKLATEIGERNVSRPKELRRAADYIEETLRQAGLDVRRHGYEVEGATCYNLEAEIAGNGLKEEIIVVGAHYDSVFGCPGANDNATGAAAALALAQLFAREASLRTTKLPRTLRFVAFVNEEPPFFQTDLMGSLVYAKECRRRGEKITAMLSLETMGCYSEEPGSQSYPFPFSLFYPSTGNFIGFVGDYSSRALVRRVVESFRRQTRFPSEGGAIPDFVPGVSWSDHWSFSKQDFPAVMVSDTAPFRYAHYHTDEDTPDKIDHERLARVVSGLEKVIFELVGGRDSP